MEYQLLEPIMPLISIKLGVYNSLVVLLFDEVILNSVLHIFIVLACFPGTYKLLSNQTKCTLQ
jgi:hypothetical protein